MGRCRIMLVLALVLGLPAVCRAEDRDESSKRILNGVISGLLGTPQTQQQTMQAQDAAYIARERERLVSLITSGEFVTSRQGETVDMMVLGVPLTHKDHVYIARPVVPSRTAY